MKTSFSKKWTLKFRRIWDKNENNIQIEVNRLLRERNSNFNSAATSHEEEVVEGEGEGGEGEGGRETETETEKEKEKKMELDQNLKEKGIKIIREIRHTIFGVKMTHSLFLHLMEILLPLLSKKKIFRKFKKITLFSKVGKKNSEAKVVHQSFLMHLTAISFLLVLEKDLLLKLISQK